VLSRLKSLLVPKSSASADEERDLEKARLTNI
jgi:hypothetical protein